MTDAERPEQRSEPRSEQPSQERGKPATGEREGKTVVVVGADGRPIGTMEVPSGKEREGSEEREDPAKLVEQPAKVMRIGSMIKQLLDEVRAAPLDEAGRQRLKEIHRRSIVELEDGLAPELTDELERLSLPFTEEAVPSEAELRIAQAQLVGWLEGLFHGIQAALVAQQMAARLQLDQIRSGRQPALPSAPGGMPVMPGVPSRQTQEQDRPVPGQYL
ncbi:MAG TPA: bacterial proteasome activator family protein [Natronosporangium sp.]|nr:bacterial proteasome activator family protein [Natronosporangium sp.]